MPSSSLSQQSRLSQLRRRRRATLVLTAGLASVLGLGIGSMVRFRVVAPAAQSTFNFNPEQNFPPLADWPPAPPMASDGTTLRYQNRNTPRPRVLHTTETFTETPSDPQNEPPISAESESDTLANTPLLNSDNLSSSEETDPSDNIWEGETLAPGLIDAPPKVDKDFVGQGEANHSPTMPLIEVPETTNPQIEPPPRLNPATPEARSSRSFQAETSQSPSPLSTLELEQSGQSNIGQETDFSAPL